jgi:hypothetical protein
VTFFGLVLTPVFYVAILRLVERRRVGTAPAEQPAREATIHA